MINAKNELHFLFLNIKAFINFKIKCLFASILYGHFIFYKNKKKYLENNKNKKLHLGANKNIEGFLNSQITSRLPINITKVLPFDSDTFDIIFSTHVIEHIHRKQISLFIKECFRILKPGGINIICTPSIKKISKISYSDNIEKKKILFNRQNKWHNDDLKSACHQINLTMRNFGHRFILDDEYCEWLAKKNGYSKFKCIEINEMSDESIKKYLLNEKSDVWFAESDIYILTK